MPVLRTICTMIVLGVLTIICAPIVIIAALVGIPNGSGSIYDVIPRFWARAALRTAGVRVQMHDLESLDPAGTYIFISNHVSLFDILALVTTLPRHNFVAKAELFRIPVFGAGMRVLGTVPIDRDNQKAAFGAYRTAAERIQGGSSVVVFPEGTRGREYPLRSFKKGPFVLAIKAAVPIVPLVVFGTIEILPKGRLVGHPGCIDVYVLDQVPTAGLTYDDRDALANTVHTVMQKKMDELLLNR